MEIVTLRFNKRTNAGKAVEALLKLLEGQKGVEVVQERTQADFNADTLKSIKEAKEGKVIQAKNARELIKKLLA